LRIYRNQVPYRRWGRKVVVPAGELDRFIKELPGATAEEAAVRAEARG